MCYQTCIAALHIPCISATKFSITRSRLTTVNFEVRIVSVLIETEAFEAAQPNSV